MGKNPKKKPPWEERSFSAHFRPRPYPRGKVVERGKGRRETEASAVGV